MGVCEQIVPFFGTQAGGGTGVTRWGYEQITPLPPVWKGRAGEGGEVVRVQWIIVRAVSRLSL